MNNKDLIKKEERDVLLGTDPLQKIELSEEKQKELLLETFGDALADKIPILSQIINYSQSYKDKVDAARLAIFLNKVEQKMESHDSFAGALDRLLTTNSGLAIFQKVVRILNNDNFDLEFIEVLAQALKKISDVDFNELFEELNYILSQIEKLSAQAILLLSRYHSWKLVPLNGGTTTSGQTLMGDWDTQATIFFARTMNITDERIKKRLAHAFRELQSGGLLFINTNKRLDLTPIGAEVYEYIA